VSWDSLTFPKRLEPGAQQKRTVSPARDLNVPLRSSNALWNDPTAGRDLRAP
jgi:hypothetical protein